MFALVIVLLNASLTTGNIEIKASTLGVFDNISECFAARESFASAVFGMPEGYYPPNTQAVCIPVIPTIDQES